MKTACFVGMITIAATALAQAPSSSTVQNTQSSSAAAQTKDAHRSEAGTDETAGAVLEVELTRGLDARKLRVGDPVVARCTRDFSAGDEILIPKAKLIGHVAEVQQRSKGKVESMLRIAWDKALMPDGREVRLTASIQAILLPAILVDDSDEGPMPGRWANSRPAAASVVRHLSSTATPRVRSTESTGVAADNALDSKSSGVMGIKGLQLNSTSSSHAGSVIYSSSQNVRLESGTRLILRVSLQ